MYYQEIGQIYNTDEYVSDAGCSACCSTSEYRKQPNLPHTRWVLGPLLVNEYNSDAWLRNNSLLKWDFPILQPHRKPCGRKMGSMFHNQLIQHGISMIRSW